MLGLGNETLGGLDEHADHLQLVVLQIVEPTEAEVFEAQFEGKVAVVVLVHLGDHQTVVDDRVEDAEQPLLLSRLEAVHLFEVREIEQPLGFPQGVHSGLR